MKPILNDVSTDLDDPPELTRAAALPANQGRDMHLPDRFKPLIEEHYGHLRPLEVEADPAAVYQAALDQAHERGWEVHYDDALERVIEAVAVTRWLRFRDDVAIRVQRMPTGGARVDMRSKSRLGKGDLGKNAERIHDFLSELERTLLA